MPFKNYRLAVTVYGLSYLAMIAVLILYGYGMYLELFYMKLPAVSGSHLLVLLILLELCYLLNLMYCFYFSAKMIKSCRLKREAQFSEYIGYFFLVWLFPIGVWFIQPQLNRLVRVDLED